MQKPFSIACERNREPILAQLAPLFAPCRRVLEIGSGTGQHAVYFGANLPHLTWQTSDLPQHHAGILAWLEEAQLPNVLAPIALEVASDAWPAGPFDAVFSANTCHIMAWPQVQLMMEGVGKLLEPGGLLVIYGPFNDDGRFTSPSNAQFDAYLRAQAAHMGIRDAQAMDRLAAEHGMTLQADHPMPANNRFRVWRRDA